MVQKVKFKKWCENNLKALDRYENKESEDIPIAGLLLVILFIPYLIFLIIKGYFIRILKLDE